MDSSRSTTIGLGLIMAIFFLWFLWNQPKNDKPTASKDSISNSVGAGATSRDSAMAVAPSVPSFGDSLRHSAVFAVDSSVDSSASPLLPITVATPLYRTTISPRGARLTSFVLSKYKKWDGGPLDLVGTNAKEGGDVNLKFVASDGKLVNTAYLPFRLTGDGGAVGADGSKVITATFALDTGKSIEKVFRFDGSTYLIGIEFKLHGLEPLVSGYHYILETGDPLPYAEQRTSEDAAAAIAFAGIAGDMEELNATKIGETERKTVNGNIDYVGSRTKYFTKSIITKGLRTSGADLEGFATKAADGGEVEHYKASASLPIARGMDQSIPVKYYLGPLEYDRITALGVGMDQTMHFGWAFIVRPISIHLMLPFFLWLHGFIANWGLVIIVFSIMIKLVTIPLSTGQMRSMRKMQVLQPKVAEIREKYKDDATKMNSEMMKVYKTYGVNPAGGCLPTILQMPILFALYSVLSNVIELRQANFAFWIHDLSAPDALFRFGTHIPLLGDQLSGLTLLLGATMFIQQKFTITDPRQKSMLYIMPVVFTFMFNSLPSGVALYYFMFNLFGIAQQIYLTKIAPPIDLEKLKIDPKNQKSGGLMARLQSMEEKARAQRKNSYSGKK